MLSVAEAAERVGASPRRLRQLASSGRIPARKVGRDWQLDSESIEALRGPKLRGRPLSSSSAWGLLALLSGDRPAWVDRRSRQRLERLLGEPERVVNLIDKSQPRAKVVRYWLPPEDLPGLGQEPGLVRSGLSALSAAEFDLFYFEAAFDAYLDERRLRSLVRRFQPLADAPEPNVSLRIPSEKWVLGKGPQAPAAVVAVDLLGNRDQRARAAGRDYLLRALMNRG